MAAPMTIRFEWERAVKAADVTPMAKLLGLVLATYADPDGTIPERFTPGIARLCADTGASRNTVLAAMKVLEQSGLVAVARPENTRRGHRRADIGTVRRQRNAYALALPQTSTGSADEPVTGSAAAPVTGSVAAPQPSRSSPSPSPGSDADASASPGDADGPDTSWSSWARAHGLDPDTRDLDTVEAWIGDDLDLDAQDLNALDAMLARGAHPHAVRNTARALTRGVAR